MPYTPPPPHDPRKDPDLSDSSNFLPLTTDPNEILRRLMNENTPYTASGFPIDQRTYKTKEKYLRDRNAWPLNEGDLSPAQVGQPFTNWIGPFTVAPAAVMNDWFVPVDLFRALGGDMLSYSYATAQYMNPNDLSQMQLPDVIRHQLVRTTGGPSGGTVSASPVIPTPDSK